MDTWHRRSRSTIRNVRLARLLGGLTGSGLLLILQLILLAAPAGASTSPGQIKTFGVPGTWPTGIVSGPDGNLWFTELYTDRIGRITPSGQVTEFPVPTPQSQPKSIAVGSDGNLWFTEQAADRIGRITTSGEITEFPLPTSSVEFSPSVPDSFSGPTSIAAGPDGNLWFTEQAADRIGRITTSGEITEFALSASPQTIAKGPDGRLWFTESVGLAGEVRIGRIASDGRITEFRPGGVRPGDITAGPDGNLWFSERSDAGIAQIGRITPKGQATLFSLPSIGLSETATAGPGDIVLGSDGNLWFTARNPSKIGRITPAGQITQFPLPIHSSGPEGITAGPDGNLWFTESRAGKIGRITSGRIGVDVRQVGSEVRGDAVRFRVACAGSSAGGVCRGTLRLNVRPHDEKALTTLAKTRYRLRSGAHRVVVLPLDRSALHVLTTARAEEVLVIVSATVRGGYPTSRGVSLSVR
jgi:streptogramin lyase